MVKVLDTWKPRERSRQVVLDKPALEFGHTPKELKQIRSRMSYQHWKKMAAWVKSNPSSKEILKELHRSRDGGGQRGDEGAAAE